MTIPYLRYFINIRLSRIKRVVDMQGIGRMGVSEGRLPSMRLDYVAFVAVLA